MKPLRVFSPCLFMLVVLPVVAEPALPVGSKTVYLLDQDERKTAIATIEFEASETGTKYRLVFSEDVFQQEFLSMRPFKCLHADSRMVCHMPYLYEKTGILTQNDMIDLEYDLLFLHKETEEYGINPWNGIYYVLTASGESISGELHEVDLNVLVAPPPAGELRPVTRDMLHKSNPSMHIYPELLIE
ncbi:MAG: hypothetical protein MI673_05355 [Thiotrichales bacterium]|nr:hypothetical protein [Thiotrichales bacterium]